ncbi:MAG: hypothetical protein JXP73_01440 [Deltaproteobacteria bacterium]|nr:hypothetical protein [Deltaproteobacteria bacterium]
MAARKSGSTLPLPLPFLAARLAVWLGRVLQEQVDFLKVEDRLLGQKLGTEPILLTDAERRRLDTLGKKSGGKGLGFYYREAARAGMHDARSGGDRVSARGRQGVSARQR